MDMSYRKKKIYYLISLLWIILHVCLMYLYIYILHWKIYYEEQIDDIIYSYLHEKRKIKDAYIKKSEEEE